MKNSMRTFLFHAIYLSFVLLLLCFFSAPQSYAISNTSIYYGNYVPNGFQIGTSLAQIEADGGKGLAIIPWYLNWTTGFPTNTMTAIRAHGSIPALTWQPDAGGINSAYSLSKIINGTYDNYLTQFAQAAKSWGHPFFLRFAHEMNGTWYGWSEQVNGNSKGQYVQMWQHVHNIFTTVGASNVTWVWCPNVGSITGLYPGDSYVDWTCMDGYNWGTSQSWSKWQTFSQIFQSTYQAIVNVAPTKPMMIGETASVEQGGNKAAWITDALTVQLPNNFPQIKAFLWFNEANTNWRIETSTTAQQAFHDGIASSYYASNQFSSLATSPIPPFDQLNGVQPTSQNTPTSTPTPTSVSFGTPTVTPTNSPNATTLLLSICPHGLGNCGDNMNANGGGNTQVAHTKRNISVTLFDSHNTQIATQQGQITYVPSAQNFQGSISFQNVPSGSYIISLKVDGFLPKQIPGIISLNQGQSVSLPVIQVVTGDINNDNQIDILDYNALISCFGTKQSTSTCTAPITTLSPGADINDDGSVTPGDYNLFLRELSVQKGN